MAIYAQSYSLQGLQSLCLIQNGKAITLWKRNIFFLDVVNHLKVEKQSITYMNNERLLYDLAD